VDNNDSEIQVKKPKYNGVGVKFYNLAPYEVDYFWEGGVNMKLRQGYLEPYQAVGTCSFPGHVFFMTKANDPNKVLKSFRIESGTALYVYDPIADGSMKRSSLTKKQLERYYEQLTNLNFAKEYKEFTGSEWLAMFPKARPTHKMFRADYFNQVHTVHTNETQYQLWPSDNMIDTRVDYEHKSVEIVEESQIRPHDIYRKSGELQLELKVLSVAPRVFEIKNFLSDVEVDHILELGKKITLAESTVGQTKSKGRQKSSSRTSQNAWVDREESPIIDAIYRRSADLLGIDEAKFRWRHEEEDSVSRTISSRSKICESLQLVHYDVSQEYTAHHDFGYAKSYLPYQNARFATILFYLNDDISGGETTFPRWINGHTSDKLAVKPERGMAVLFYSSMPDGNNDDLSQHAAEPVTEGEKWLTNLWVHDPHFGRHE